MIKLLFGGQSTASEKDRLEFENYKACLEEEAFGDEFLTNPTTLISSPSLTVFHKLYRKTLQPRYSIVVQLECQNVVE